MLGPKPSKTVLKTSLFSLLLESAEALLPPKQRIFQQNCFFALLTARGNQRDLSRRQSLRILQMLPIFFGENTQSYLEDSRRLSVMNHRLQIGVIQQFSFLEERERAFTGLGQARSATTADAQGRS